MDKPRIAEVIAVEGRYDKNTLSQVVDATIVELGGFGVFNDRQLLSLLRRLAATRGLVIFTDPDGADQVLEGCSKLEEIYAPADLAVDVALPVTLYDEAGKAYSALPRGLTESVRLSKTVKVSYVKINSTAKSIALGKTFQLRAWPQPVNATNKAVTWESSNPSVAAVDSTGLVTAVKAGTADVTVTTEDGGFTAVCKITVVVPVTSVKINSTAKTLKVGKTFQLAAWPQPTNATNKTVTWTSSNSAVAKVSSKGLVTAVKAGSAVITVKTADGGKTAACKITVQAASPATVPVTSVKINSTAKTLEVGKTFQLAAWPQPTNATNKAVTWYSFNTSVATVSSTGLVTAKGKGSTNVRVMTKDGGKIAYCKITVEKPVIPAGYSVSAPTNVHWTDGFKLAWDYGRTQDGSVYQKWAYKMYNAETGAKIGSHSKKDTDGTSIEYFIKSGTIEKMTTGSYYFTV